MSKNPFSPMWFKPKGEKIKKAYDIALANKYNVNSIKDVIEILKITDPKNANDDYARNFSKVLQLFEHTLFKKLQKKGKERLVN